MKHLFRGETPAVLDARNPLRPTSGLGSHRARQTTDPIHLATHLTMRRNPIRSLALLAFVLGTLSACDPAITASLDSRIDESELTFVRFAPDAPPLADTVVSFWAVRGENRQVEIRYLSSLGYPSGLCLEFKVPGNSLLQAPDGRRYEKGDSVRITIRVVDRSRFDFEFEPSGLRFEPDHPAELRVLYNWADRDYNGDGVLDERDKEIEENLAVWRQERSGDPWMQLQTERLEDKEEVRAVITGFTRYALAEN